MGEMRDAAAKVLQTLADYTSHAPRKDVDGPLLQTATGLNIQDLNDANEIARDIISADIAIFDTSDRNPNVMIELGVALTWGVRVLPIRERAAPPLPTDISGQTWSLYEDSGARFVDSSGAPDRVHDERLVAMVARALQRKVRRAGR